ncbi:hypothetical protein VE23_16985 [Paenibacillus sp. D9]|nr:hypothetical protein VE23_16985 [Paenibacillus sp. D9]
MAVNASFWDEEERSMRQEEAEAPVRAASACAWPSSDFTCPEPRKQAGPVPEAENKDILTSNPVLGRNNAESAEGIGV